MNPTLFIATPLHDARVHAVYTAGLLDAAATWPCRWFTVNGTSIMRQRDQLVAKFLESECTHLLWVDSDIAWSADEVSKLLGTDREFVAGCYARKSKAGLVPAMLLPNRDGELIEASHVATGFLLVSRAAVELMAASAERYSSGGVGCLSFFHQRLDEGTEDLSFCRRYRECGGQVWLHTGCVVGHYDGNTLYRPDMANLLAPPVAAAAE
ncbi:MAG TPA: hypothetical protein VFR23_24735 [Jiangellaceae bacterium]|nr:hypothetical protein [Jiangellaceae bacterium]